IQSETFAITLSTTRIVVCDTKSINCEVSAWLFCQYVCYCYRPGSIRADAFRGHGLSLLEKTALRGLRTRAIPAGQGMLRQLLHRTKKIGLYFRGVTALL